MVEEEEGKRGDPYDEEVAEKFKQDYVLWALWSCENKTNYMKILEEDTQMKALKILSSIKAILFALLHSK